MAYRLALDTTRPPRIASEEFSGAWSVPLIGFWFWFKATVLGVAGLVRRANGRATNRCRGVGVNTRDFFTAPDRRFFLFGQRIVLVCAGVGLPLLVSGAEFDPLCDFSSMRGEWGKDQVPRVRDSRAPFASALAHSTSAVARFGTPGGVIPSLTSPRVQQTVEPSVETKPIADRTTLNLKDSPKFGEILVGVGECANAIQNFRSMDTPVKLTRYDKDYACALARVDRSCLTRTESQPHVPDPTIPFRSVVAFTLRGEAFCTGLLLTETSVLTSRHCFVDQKTGAVRPELTGLKEGDLVIETLDRKREVSIQVNLSSLELNNGFDIDSDPVTIKVETSRRDGARDLPRVELDGKPQEKQLLWLVGPVHKLDQVAAIRKAISPPPQSTQVEPLWVDSIRWSANSGAQCRVIAINGSCLYHSCQTFPGFSGSPLITAARAGKEKEDPGVIVYSGVHAGMLSKEAPFGWPGCTKKQKDFDGFNFRRFNVGYISQGVM